MRVLLTGGSGFVGSHVADQLSREGIPVRVLVRRSSDTAHLRSLPGIELVYGSVEVPQCLPPAMRGISHVLHAAGVLKARRSEDFHRVNAVGTDNLVRAALAAGDVERFVLISSLTVSGPCRDGKPVADDVTPAPLTQYGSSKLAAESALLTHQNGLPVTILRPGAVYGPRDREILPFFKSVQVGVLPLLAKRDNRVSMVYASDCAAACVRALFANVPSGSIYHIDDGQPHSLTEMLAEVEAALGKRPWLSFRLPERVVRAAALASELYGKASGQAVIFTRDKCKELFEEWVCDGTRGRQQLGYSPAVAFSRGVRLTADWYRRMGWLR